MHGHRTDDMIGLRSHSDRATEFMGIVAKKWALHHNVYTTQTGSHSPESNGRAENCIRVIKPMVRRSLTSSGLPLGLWRYAVRHSAELL
eukprot:5885526-Amphidinium_carterae.1